MPIHCPLQLVDILQNQFDQIDYRVIGQAFNCQNELGRLCDESAYENDMDLRMRALGCQVHTQVPISVSHETFSKTYRLDFICDHAVYEFKTVQEFVGAHNAQALHYAMLLDIRHVKLLNFRPDKVVGRLCFNAVPKEDRFRFRIADEGFRIVTPQCQQMRQRMLNLLQDWGAFLDARLYEEALVYFCASSDEAQQRLEFVRNGNSIGTHQFNRHHNDVAFIVSSVAKQSALYLTHLKRLLSLTRLMAIQWINLNHSTIELTTIARN